jgi:hypothetical protein
MTSGPIQRPSSPSIPASLQRAEAAPAEAPPAKTEATAPAQGPSGGSSTAPTSFAQAKAETSPSMTPGFVAPSTLTRSRPTDEAAPADAKAADQTEKAHYPVKWQAEEALKQLNADPRVKGDTRMQLGKMIGSPGFDALGPKGQVAAFELFKANLGDKDALKRVNTAVNSMDAVKSKQGRLDVLEGLRDGSPLTQQKLDKTTSLLHSKEFGKLKQSDQELVTTGIKDAKADPARVENLQKIVEDPRFKGLSDELRTEVIRSAAAGRGTAAELLDAATFTPGVGLNLTGSAADQAEFTNILRRSMVRSPSFRAQMNTQNTNGAHPIQMDVGRNQPNVLGDASGMFFTPPAPGRHTVDLADIQQFPHDPTRGATPDATTGDQVVVHFMVEAMNEVQGNTFGVSHQRGIDAENAYRADLGQNGRISSRTFGPGPNQATSVYTGGHNNEVITFDNNGGITNLQF